MKIILETELNKITRQFNFDYDTVLDKVIDFEPDCKIYILRSEFDDKYALVCRDFYFEDLDAEARILKDELNIAVLERFKYQDDYWYETKEFDDFAYIFSLNRILWQK